MSCTLPLFVCLLLTQYNGPDTLLAYMFTWVVGGDIHHMRKRYFWTQSPVMV